MTVRAHWISGLAAAAFVWASAATAFADPIDDGLAAYERQDYAAAAAILEPLSETGDPDARYALSVVHVSIFWDGADPARAAVLRRQAAEAGVVEAQLAMTGHTGGDPAGIRDWFLRAARQGSTFAMWGLELLHRDGERNYAGGPDLAPDPAEAWYWSWVEYNVRTEAARIAALASPTPAEAAWLSGYDRVNDVQPGAERVVTRVSPPPEGLGIMDLASVNRRAEAFRIKLEREPR